MKISRIVSAPALAGMVAVLSACTHFSPDGGMQRVDALTRERIGQNAVRDNSQTQTQTQAQVRQLLSAPLSVDAAVSLALLNNKGSQATLAELGIAEADLVQAGRLNNPRFSYGRLSGSGGAETDRSVMFDLAGLLTMPMRKAIEQRRFDQAQLQTALQLVRLASDTRRAWYQAVAAQQSAIYLQQVHQAALASAELAQRMAKAGNWSRLDEAREQVFQVEVSTQLARAEHHAIATRERLIRLLGLPDEQVPLQLPDRLPALPEQMQPATEIEANAIARRLDVQVARMETEATAQSLGLTRHTRFVNVLEAGYLNRSNADSSRDNGYQVELSLPLFDWGTARVQRAEAVYMRSLQRTADIAVQARSEARESYSLYRTQFEVAHRYRDEIVPLRKRVSDEVLLRYNGMLASVFELLTDARLQISSVNASIEAQRDFWIADAELQFVMHGGSPAAASSANLSTTVQTLPGSSGH